MLVHGVASMALKSGADVFKRRSGVAVFTDLKVFLDFRFSWKRNGVAVSPEVLCPVTAAVELRVTQQLVLSRDGSSGLR